MLITVWFSFWGKKKQINVIFEQVLGGEEQNKTIFLSFVGGYHVCLFFLLHIKIKNVSIASNTILLSLIIWTVLKFTEQKVP